jgi:hypothetical protein
MNLEDFESLKSMYISNIEKQGSINKQKMDIDLIIDQTFYLYKLGLMPDFFEKIDSPNFEEIISSYIGATPNKDTVIKNILNFKSFIKIYYGSFDQWKQHKTNPVTVQENTAEDIVVATYRAAKKLYENEISSFDEFYDYIKNYSSEANEAFKDGSAKFYYSMFKKMMEGNMYSGNSATQYTKYFLENIYNDYGLEKLNLGLKSLEQHIIRRTQNEIKIGNEIALKFGANFKLK